MQPFGKIHSLTVLAALKMPLCCNGSFQQTWKDLISNLKCNEEAAKYRDDQLFNYSLLSHPKNKLGFYAGWRFAGGLSFWIMLRRTCSIKTRFWVVQQKSKWSLMWRSQVQLSRMPQPSVLAGMACSFAPVNHNDSKQSESLHFRQRCSVQHTKVTVAGFTYLGKHLSVHSAWLLAVIRER